MFVKPLHCWKCAANQAEGPKDYTSMNYEDVVKWSLKRIIAGMFFES